MTRRRYSTALATIVDAGDLAVIPEAAALAAWASDEAAWHCAGCCMRLAVEQLRETGEPLPDELRLALAGLGMTADFAAGVRAAGRRQESSRTV